MHLALISMKLLSSFVFFLKKKKSFVLGFGGITKKQGTQ